MPAAQAQPNPSPPSPEAGREMTAADRIRHASGFGEYQRAKKMVLEYQRAVDDLQIKPSMSDLDVAEHGVKNARLHEALASVIGWGRPLLEALKTMAQEEPDGSKDQRTVQVNVGSLEENIRRWTEALGEENSAKDFVELVKEREAAEHAYQEAESDARPIEEQKRAA